MSDAVGIVVSTIGEASLLLDSLDSKVETVYQNKFFFSGSLNGRVSAVISICGVGKANAAHATTLLIERYALCHVFNTGVAGAYPGSGLMIGDIAVARNEFYGDEGLVTRSGFHPMDEIGLPLVSSGGKNYYNRFPLFVPENFEDIAPKGNFVSVSSCTGTAAGAETMESRFDAICENMEGAAIAHICALNNVPVTELRGISNIVGDRDASPLNPSDISKASQLAQQLLIRKLTK